MPSPSLPLPPQQSHINLSDLKSQIVKRIGPERARRYFNHLNRFLSQKLQKHEFNKLCIASVGQENVALHNQLIRSILTNVYCAKVAPKVSQDESFAKTVKDGRSSLPLARLPSVWSNGDILPPSPRKSRSGVRRIKDHLSPLGQNGWVNATSHQSLIPSEEVIVCGNGDLGPCDLKRPMQHHHCRISEQGAKRHRGENSLLHDQVSLHSKGLVELVAPDDQEDVEGMDDLQPIRGPLQAPLGIPFCPASVGGAQRNVNGSNFSFATCYAIGELCSTEDLRTQMEKIARGQGLEGVMVDCANLLNNGLNAYLKRLIESSTELVRARVGRHPLKQLVHKQQSHMKPVNGVWPGYQMQVQSSVAPLEDMYEQQNPCLISLQDFKVAMELNPQKLGEDWPLLLEKMCLHSFDK